MGILSALFKSTPAETPAVSSVSTLPTQLGATLTLPPYEGMAGNPRYAVPSTDPNQAEFNYSANVEAVPVVRSYWDKRRQGVPTNLPDNGFHHNPERWDAESPIPDPDTFPVSGYTQERAPDPRWNPGQPLRPQRAQSNWRFTRPFAQDVEWRLNGHHFSMADHHRRYPISGLSVATERRNTYRIEPPPRDISIQDVPAPALGAETPQGGYQSPGVPFALFRGNPSGRLD